MIIAHSIRKSKFKNQKSLVHPREVIKSAILANAHSFILVHNHPSGDQQPTKEDHKITEEMIEVGRLMQIPLKDHVIIGKGWFSFFERDCREGG